MSGGVYHRVGSKDFNYVFVVADKVLIDNSSKVSERQLRNFLDLCWVKYVKARIEPGKILTKIMLSPYVHDVKAQLLALSVHSQSVNRGHR